MQLATKLSFAHSLHLLLSSETVVDQLGLDQATFVTALFLAVSITYVLLYFFLVPQHPQHVDLVVLEQLLVVCLLLVIFDCGLPLCFVVVGVLQRLGGVVWDDLA